MKPIQQLNQMPQSSGGAKRPQAPMSLPKSKRQSVNVYSVGSAHDVPVGGSYGSEDNDDEDDDDDASDHNAGGGTRGKGKRGAKSSGFSTQPQILY